MLRLIGTQMVTEFQKIVASSISFKSNHVGLLTIRLKQEDNLKRLQLLSSIYHVISYKTRIYNSQALRNPSLKIYIGNFPP
jgi:hypothetical protein